MLREVGNIQRMKKLLIVHECFQFQNSVMSQNTNKGCKCDYIHLGGLFRFFVNSIASGYCYFENVMRILYR